MHIWRVIFCLLTLFSIKTQASVEFLPVEEAFKPSLSVNNDFIQAHWEIADEYYLYESRFSISIPESSGIKLEPFKIIQQGKEKDDPYMGKVVVHYHEVDMQIPWTAPEATKVEVTLSYQGCAEAGLCYLPTTFSETLIIPARSQNDSISTNTLKTTVQKSSTSTAADILQNKSLWVSALLFLLLGLGLSFTPCVLPMVPILSSIIVGQNSAQLSTKRGFLLSLSYVLGMSLAYTLAGLLVAMSGARLQIYMQMPVVLISFSVIFIVLALSMFGLYELRLPNRLQNAIDQKMGQKQGGKYTSVFFMGVFSALLVSPCVSAPLAGVLLYIAQTGNELLGALALFSMGIGMGLPLLIIGSTGANILPRAGVWMDRVRAVFGVALLLMALYLVKHLIPENIIYGILGGLAIISSVYLGAFRAGKSGWQLLFQGVGIILLIYGSLLLIKSFVGNNFSDNSLANNTSKSPLNNVVIIRNSVELDKTLAVAKQAQKPVLIDIYADWCIACIEMEHTTFKDEKIVAELKDFVFIKLDLTNNNEANVLLDRWQIVGPPALVFYDPNGNERSDLEMIGLIAASELLPQLLAVK